VHLAPRQVWTEYARALEKRKNRMLPDCL
jgi:hypothetical protein